MSDRPITIDACWKREGVWGDASCPELVRHTHCRNCERFRSAASTLLDREPPAGYREEWTERVAQPLRRKLPGTRSIVVFRCGEEWLALPTTAFLEVADVRPIHSLPHRHNAVVQGLVTIRGELLICISLSGLLGFEASSTERNNRKGRVYQRMMVVAQRGERTVFTVDEIHVGHQYHPDELKPVPATVAASVAPYSVGLLVWEDRNIGVLDNELFFYTLHRKLA